MGSTLAQTYQSIADINLWLKARTGDDLYLADIPTLIPLRWDYFRDNWEFIRQDLINNLQNDPNPDFFKQQINDFSVFIDSQRNSSINPFADNSTFYQYFAIFNNVRIDAINLTNQETTLMQNEINRVQEFSKYDFETHKNTIVSFRDATADSYGLSDASYNTVFNRTSSPAQIIPTIVEENYLLTLSYSIKSIDFILANLFAVDTAIDAFALARANANNPDVNIGSYQSGKLVKLNYGQNLESLAYQYLGDPNKWIDIAIANGLKPPYIDEVGTLIPLLTNGNGNQINLAETDTDGNLNINKLYINQPIFISSISQVVANQRTITNIRQVPVSGEIILELDGKSNMSLYQLADAASIRVYQPNTVNSMFFILIPSPNPLPNGRTDEIPWFLVKLPQDEQQTKVDIAIDDNGEINFTTNGDLSLSYGLQNAVQAIKLKIATELGTLRYHPTFGMVSVVGKTNSDVNSIRNLIIQSLTAQIQADSRFDRIETIDVEYLVNNKSNQGVAAMAISMTVRLAGGSRVLPISFTVNNL